MDIGDYTKKKGRECHTLVSPGEVNCAPPMQGKEEDEMRRQIQITLMSMGMGWREVNNLCNFNQR